MRQISGIAVILAVPLAACSSATPSGATADTLSGAGMNVYREAADGLFPRRLDLGPAYTATYSWPEGIADTRWDALLSHVDICVAQLESARADFLGDDMPNQQIATLQLLQCLGTKGWEIGVDESFIVD
jgi:hypothetical protein